MKNAEIAKIFYEISFFLMMEEVAFKPQAYEKAAISIKDLNQDVGEIYKKGGLKALEDIPGVGKGIAERIEEFLKTGQIRDYEKFKKKYPIDIENLTAIEGIGAKTILKFYKKLGVKNVKDLEKAVLEGKIRKLEGFGEKTEANILKGIEFLKKSSGRFVLGFILPTIREIESRLKKLKEVENIAVAGSVRRWKETIGDADFLIIVKGKPLAFAKASAGKVMDFFVSMPEVDRVFAHGRTKSAIRLKDGLEVDVRVVSPESFGAALNYFTGSKEHNISLRQIAIKKGYKLNEYGLFKKGKRIGGKTEEEIYELLGLRYIEPELRENFGEIEASRKNQLPKLIGYGDLRGDLQIQTDWTDGSSSIEEMAEEARQIGLEYIAITDHTKSLAMTGGSDEKKLLKQIDYINKLNARYKTRNERFRILTGAEVNILKDGSLDIKDEVLEKLDLVGAAIHSNFNLSKEEQTKRMIKAMENPNVDIIFHPTGRIIKQREPYEIDINEIIRTAKRTGTVLEIDAYPDRLDLKDDHIKKALRAGVKLAIDSDAHNPAHFKYLEFGIAQARRGWTEKKDVINTMSLDNLMKFLKLPKDKRF
ncbi:MAG: DNA polymerase/3'-5' exonuclease PolX [Parcubacteria group bacterium]|nr:DNA polymerase/3'-5' exonuclease PolX [Parcubacteria group bacterium]